MTRPCALLLALSLAALANAPAGSAEDVVVDTATVLESRYMGLGVQWDPYDQVGYRLRESDWRRIFARVDFMRPQILRTMLHAHWYAKGFGKDGRPVYDWNDPHMRDLYRILDYAQRRDIDVVLGEWESPGRRIPGTEILDADPRWTQLVADCLDQLRRVRGYTVVKYYNLVNEPNGDWSSTKGNWPQWKAAIRNLEAALDRRNALAWPQIVGPDNSWNDEWVDRTVDELHDVIGTYETHRYASREEVESGALERQMRAKRDYIRAHDPIGVAKRFLMGEAGMLEGKIEAQDTQARRYDFIYGVWMADYVVQTIRAGQAGVIAWDLDDAMHVLAPVPGPCTTLPKGECKQVHAVGYGKKKLKGWGFWNSLGGRHGYPESDAALRPWYDVWSVLSRAFPRGSATLAVSAPDGLRAAAARTPDVGVSIAIVNTEDVPRTVRLLVPGAGRFTIEEYRYFESERLTDAAGFPKVARVHKNVSLADGIRLDLPGCGLVTLSKVGAQNPGIALVP